CLIIGVFMFVNANAKIAVSRTDYSHLNEYYSGVWGDYTGGYVSQIANYGVISENGKQELRIYVQVTRGNNNLIHFYNVNGNRWGFFETEARSVNCEIYT
ncbi:MAG: hypothetical protein RR929_02415, partial [Erysipelotrichaceae bacterium]